MGVKAEVINKNVILLRVTEKGTIQKKEFKECFLYKNTHSIREGNWRFYCKNEFYYACQDYALIIDENYENKAFNELIDCAIANNAKQVSHSSNMMNKLKDNIDNLFAISKSLRKQKKNE